MEEWTELREDDDGGDGSSKGKCGFSFDLDLELGKFRFDSSKEKLRSLFDQVLVDFMREKSSNKCIKPIPVICVDGRPVDLFKLFWIVRKIGGHDTVTRNNLWGFVSGECGLGPVVIPSIKLIHLKYLNEMDQWLGDVSCKRDLKDRHNGLLQRLDLLSQELETKFRGILHKSQENKVYLLDEEDEKLQSGNDIDRSNTGNYAAPMHESNGFSEGQTDDDSGKHCNEDSISIMGSVKKVVKKVNSKPHEISDSIIDDEEKFSAIDMMISDVVDEAGSRKRKRQSVTFSGMLNWLVHVAKHSDDPSVGMIPECSKWREYRSDEFWVQAICVREALQIRRHDGANASENLLKDQQKKQRMHPSMYEDNILDPQATEKLRCSKRISSSAKPPSCPCCSNSCAAPQIKDTIHHEAEVGNNSLKSPRKSVIPDVEEPPTIPNHNPYEAPLEKHVSVGPLFQAEVPQWTGAISESDPKWLGKKMWDPQNGNKKLIVGLDPIGKGRQHHPCNCPFPNSVECFRFHIAEKRLRLKQEIGVVFHQWRFHHMGEEVSLSWTEEEEKRFKEMMRSYHGFSKKFIANAWRFLPSKTRENLISYHFNVYLVQRRSYQNRVTPKEVDSDDDEKECGTMGEMFGYKALHVHGFKLISCSLNKEPSDILIK